MKKGNFQYFQKQPRRLIRRLFSLLFLAAWAFCSAVGINILFYQTGITEGSKAYGQVYQAQYSVSFATGLFQYGVISPLIEEVLFRGFIYNFIKRYFNFQTALVVSSLLFGIYHGNLVQGIYGFLLGLLIACAYELYGSFAAPFLFHATANASVFTISYYHLLTFSSKGAGILTGAFLTVTAVLMLVCAYRTANVQ